METTKKNRFDRAISALVKGYLNGTLAKGHCAACAVGSLVAEGVGGKVFRKKRLLLGQTYDCSVPNSDWQDVFVTYLNRPQIQRPYRYTGAAKIQIDSTGYTWQELALVEEAFEMNTKLHFKTYPICTPEEIDTDQYNGLKAVFEVLCEIEGITDATPFVAMLEK
ncbi:hypothetical protein HNV11_20365 [Spirosoma taeanense]|uniref:Uncharacterized protein n=1 Tax=Spirosoma taeanense TaxID=2735870 RepID=A0A6M5YD87_9BACT|nr:hypothetical protein [Spirosoma taeanense]QJW91564.1 hypothetical protein HNV11_20365 [Spirosoma taeanense]